MKGMVVGMLTILVIAAGAGQLSGQEKRASGGGKGRQVSFKDDVSPVIQKHCLPCHAEESFNPSELSLDSYQGIMDGGKHGSTVVPGKPDESVIIQKLHVPPPFGDPMPLVKKKKNSDEPAKPNKLTEEEINTIARWIEQGAKDN